MRALALGCAACLAACAWSESARADGDGVYGRFDGDFELRGRAGVSFAEGGPSLAAYLGAMYLSTVGVYALYTDACGGMAPPVARSIAAGVHVAPLFLIRGAFNGERGPAFLDLFLDSLAFEIGPVWSSIRPPYMPPPAPHGTAARPQGASFDETPGLEAALELDVPLFARATGLFIGARAALRWRPGDFAPQTSTSIADRGALVALTFGWHHVLNVHAIDSGDAVVR